MYIYKYIYIYFMCNIFTIMCSHIIYYIVCIMVFITILHFYESKLYPRILKFSFVHYLIAKDLLDCTHVCHMYARTLYTAQCIMNIIHCTQYLFRRLHLFNLRKLYKQYLHTNIVAAKTTARKYCPRTL